MYPNQFLTAHEGYINLSANRGHSKTIFFTLCALSTLCHSITQAIPDKSSKRGHSESSLRDPIQLTKPCEVNQKIKKYVPDI